LTSKGEALITEVFARHKAAMDRAAEGLSKAERTALVELLKKLGLSAEERFEEGEFNHD
jgi:MarR family 2-MHQ and catechol resistance regulon transcriptional repressor